MIRYSTKEYEKVLNLNMYVDSVTKERHFSFIKNTKKYCQVFQRTNCNTFLSEYKKLKQHAKNCQEGTLKIIFQSGNYSPPNNVFEQLNGLGIHVPKDLMLYPYFIFFYVETWLKKSTVLFE
jgi:hypothetical protein